MSRTGIQTTLFREEARDIVMRCVNGSIDDVGIFTGSGSTAGQLNLAQPSSTSFPSLYRYLPTNSVCFFHTSYAAVTTFVGVLGLKDRSLGGEKIVILVGPYEHHSNMLPWREAGCDVEVLSEDLEVGGVDLEALETSLKVHKEAGNTIIGSFSAASNVTGILTDPNPITELLHRFGGLSVWDYAGAAPYVDVDMNPRMDSGERVSWIPPYPAPCSPRPT